jgi:hypothetical protein
MEKESPTESPDIAPVVPSGPTEREVREAHKLNYLIDQGEVTASEVSAANATKVQRMVDELFDLNYWQSIYHPEKMDEITPSQRVEDAVVEILNNTQGLIHAVHASNVKDQGPGKIDVVLYVDGEKEPIDIQITTRTDSGVAKKFERLPERTIPVIVPGASHVFDALKRNNPVDLRQISREVIGQVLTKMSTSKPYKELFGRVSSRLTTAH